MVILDVFVFHHKTLYHHIIIENKASCTLPLFLVQRATETNKFYVKEIILYAQTWVWGVKMSRLAHRCHFWQCCLQLMVFSVLLGDSYVWLELLTGFPNFVILVYLFVEFCFQLFDVHQYVVNIKFLSQFGLFILEKLKLLRWFDAAANTLETLKCPNLAPRPWFIVNGVEHLLLVLVCFTFCSQEEVGWLERLYCGIKVGIALE